MPEKLFAFILLSFISVTQLYAQITGPVPSPRESIKENSVSVMAAFGDTIWIGPGLNRNINNSANWLLPNDADSVTGGRARVFSLSLSRDTVVAGLGFNFQSGGEDVQTGGGYYISDDGGASWGFIPHPLEEESDTTFVYGGITYSKLPITVSQQSPPFEADHSGNIILSANWASGIVRSRDFGESWERLILPPQTADSLVPEQNYEFIGDGDNRYDPRFDQNLLGFGILIDNEDKVWAGTAGGLNISENAVSAPVDSIRWSHLQVTDEDSGLLGNWIIDIKQQPATGDIWMTNWPAGLQSFERYGIVRTSDEGLTFDRYLVDEKINDLGFMGDHIFAAGDNALFISPDNGQSWEQLNKIESPNTFIKPSAQYLSVASTSDRVWIGTSDGLVSTANLGASWEITRVDFPLQGGNQYQQDAPDVEAYAYPSPFSPGRHGIVRIKFEVEETGNVKIRLFDFGMNLIKEIENGSFSPGSYEAVWDGLDLRGRQVANGPVLYQIETAGNTIRGKFLVID